MHASAAKIFQSHIADQETHHAKAPSPPEQACVAAHQLSKDSHPCLTPEVFQRLEAVTQAFLAFLESLMHYIR